VRLVNNPIFEKIVQKHIRFKPHFLNVLGAEEERMSHFESDESLSPKTIEFEDLNLTCIDCGQEFVWTGGERLFFHDKGLKNPPKRCKPCKQAKNERLAAIANAQASGAKQRIEVIVNCAKCSDQTTVPFFPSQGRPVYCRSCFLAMNPQFVAENH
jgi:CxxC-x17-CxxC domain-containing protein